MWRKSSSLNNSKGSKGLQPAYPEGIAANPQVTKNYSVEDLVKIIGGFAAIPEEDMFTSGPLRDRYYEEQCLKNTKENSIRRNVTGLKDITSSGRGLLADFDEASHFSINVSQSQDVCSGERLNSGHPLQDISNIRNEGWRPASPICNIGNEAWRPSTATSNNGKDGWRPSSSISISSTGRRGWCPPPSTNNTGSQGWRLPPSPAMSNNGSQRWRPSSSISNNGSERWRPSSSISNNGSERWRPSSCTSSSSSNNEGEGMSGWRPTSKRKFRFFPDTPTREEDFIDESLLNTYAKKTCFKDLDFCSDPALLPPVVEQEQDEFDPLF